MGILRIRKVGLLVALAAVLVAGAFFVFGEADTASAASPHFKGKGVTLTDEGLILSASGALAGLGNGDVRISVTATADPTSTCTNPSGKSQPPGQNPAPVEVTGSQSIPAAELKNGTTPFSVKTEPPVSPIPGAPDCPGSNWTEAITDMAFTSFTITVEQPAGTTVLTLGACEISPPSSNGAIPNNNISC